MPGIFSSIVTALQNAGTPAASIPNLLSQIAGLSPNAAIQAICQTLLANSGNADVVKAEATKLAEIPNLPAAVASFIPQLQAAAATTPVNPLQVVMLVQGIEAAMHGTGAGGILAGLGL